MLMTKEFIDLIIERHGNVLNCASIDGLDCNIRGTKNYMYSSSKAATIHFTKYCALNYSNKIRVNCICPGVTDTPLWTKEIFRDSILQYQWEELDKQRRLPKWLCF